MSIRRLCFAFGLTALFFLSGCSTSLPSGDQTGPVDGEKLYLTHCAACHGRHGLGGVGVPLALPDFLENTSDEYIAMTIRVGRPGRVMPNFWHLREKEVQAIVRHVRGWSWKETPRYSDARIPGDIENGEALFRKYCVRCHGENGEGGKGTGVAFSRPRYIAIVPPALNNTGFLLSATDEMIKHTLMEGRKGTPMDSFLHKGVPEQSIDDIVAYIRSLQFQLPPDSSVVLNAPSAVLSKTSRYPMWETVRRLKKVIVDSGFVLIDEWPSMRVSSSQKTPSYRLQDIHFGNFDSINGPLGLDPRMGLFMPGRITVLEQHGVVRVLAVNPMQYSAIFNNSALNRMCEAMHGTYQTMLLEVSR